LFWGGQLFFGAYQLSVSVDELIFLVDELTVQFKELLLLIIAGSSCWSRTCL